MNEFDIFIVVALVLSVAYSAFRGLVREVFSLLSLGVGYLVALNFQDNFAEWLSDYIENDILAHLMAYAILFATAYLVIFFIGKLVKKYVKKSEMITRVDRIWGGVLGLIKGVFIVVIVLFPLQFFESTYDKLTDDSVLRPYLEDVTTFLGDNIDVHREYLEDFKEMNLQDKLDGLEDSLEDSLEDGVEGIEDLEDKIEEGQESFEELMEQKEAIQENVSSEDRKKLEDMLSKMDKK